MVEAHNRSKLRTGKGFSIGELRSVDLNPGVAKKLGVAVDKRRESVRKENIEVLKSYLNASSFRREKPRRESHGDSDKKEE